MRSFNCSIPILSFLLFINTIAKATDYHVGPSESLPTISDVPWVTLAAGDRVYIHWKDTPYKEKWVINRKGTSENPIQIIGVNGSEGQQPVIDGNGAITVAGVDYWNENRSVIKIGGSSVPSNDIAEYIIIDNLEIRSARPPYQFTNDSGGLEDYIDNAASIQIEKGAHITIKNCTLHDSGNGLFTSPSGGETQDILIEQNHLYDNGIVGSAYQHNSYTSATNIIFQYNYYGPLRAGADGNNLKDRSAGLVVKYNWIESGSRLLDLVNADGVLVEHESYATTHVFGNVLLKPEASGNSQIVHYGGDTGSEDTYRKGNLYFYNNTVISTRDGFTTLLNMSTNEETATVFNNVIYTSAAGNNFAMINNNGIFNLHHNWLKPEWKICHCGSPAGTVTDLGDNILGVNPLFVDFVGQNFRLENGSELINHGDIIPSFLTAEYDVMDEYREHQQVVERFVDDAIDIGAFENTFGIGIEEVSMQKNLTLYPNPANDILTIYFENGMNEVKIYDGLGQLVKTATTSSIPVSDLKTGVYFVYAISNSGIVSTSKFIKL